MCGINLIIDKQKYLSSDPITKMSDITHHRGPDEANIKIVEGHSKTYHLASNRLKITDQSEAAAQPFTIQSSKQALLFNGEIYNFYELKNELLKNEITFHSNSDTEVLFHWLRTYGKEGITKLEGMFSFIFIDPEKDEIILARDRFGIKPLYFYEDENYFIASSEIKSILGSGLVKKELNARQIHHYLLYKYAKTPETFYLNINEIESGQALYFHENAWGNTQFYSDNLFTDKSELEVESIKEIILDSLLRQIDTKVPLGLLLSGGVDSTLLLALAHLEGYSLPTYSIINSKADKSFGTKDYHYSRLAAKTYSSDHHEIEVDISLFDQFDNFIANIDQPIGDSSYMMTSAICKKASESMKILLSGAGADELFAGYNRHKAFYNHLYNAKSLKFLMPILKPILNNLPSGIQHPFRKHINLIKKWSKSYDKSPKQTFHNYLTFHDLGFENQQINHERVDTDLFEWALKHDQNNYLVNDVLALSDRAPMLHGVELRVPFLDEKLVNYLDGFPAKTRILKGPKWILKEILKKNGGGKFINRPKEGFGLPLSNWLFDKKSEHIWENMQSENSILFNYLDKRVFDKLIRQQKSRAEDHGPLLWSIIVLGNWLDLNFG